jgi:hypothetical protein
MAVVDHERAWLRLKEHVLEKRSHGTSELVERMAELEVECAVPEGEEGYSQLPAHDKPADGRAAGNGRESAMATR